MFLYILKGDREEYKAGDYKLGLLLMPSTWIVYYKMPPLPLNYTFM